MNAKSMIKNIYNVVSWKRVIIVVCFVLAYVLLLIPYVITIPFSIPGVDDFSMCSNLISSSRVVSAIDRANALYFNFGSAIWISMFLNVLFCPIISYGVESMTYGFTMLVIFFLFIIVLNVFYRNLFIFEIRIENTLCREMMVFLATAIPFLGTFYPEVFYWYDGSHYAWFMSFSLLACSCMMKYFHTGRNKYFILLIVWGMLSCMNVPYAVPVLLFYFVMLQRYRGINLHFKDFLPVFFFVCGVLSFVLSPGGQARHDAVGGSAIGMVELVDAGIMTIIGALSRLHTLLVECPCSFALLFLAFLFGIWNKDRVRRSFGSVCCIFIITFLSTMGALYPVMLGYGECVMPNRICFLFDFLFFMMMVLTTFTLGQYLGWICNYGCWDKSKWIMVIAIYMLIVYTSLIAGRWYPESCWAKAFFSLAAVKEEHDEWMDIYREIEATDEKNVVIKHERINTTGILNDPQIREDKEYWVNGAAARFFKKESIRIEWQDDLVTE